MEGKNVKDLLSNVGSGGGAPAAGAVPAAVAAGGAPAEAPKEEEKKPEKEEESDDDMVCLNCSLFLQVLILALKGLWSIRLIFACCITLLSDYLPPIYIVMLRLRMGYAP